VTIVRTANLDVVKIGALRIVAKDGRLVAVAVDVPGSNSVSVSRVGERDINGRTDRQRAHERASKARRRAAVE
jgi:hypothetical protein